METSARQGDEEAPRETEASPSARGDSTEAASSEQASSEQGSEVAVNEGRGLDGGAVAWADGSDRAWQSPEERASAGDSRVGAVYDVDRGLHTDDDHHVQRLSHDFFARPRDLPVHDPWDESAPPPAMTPGARRAMYATGAILAVSLISLGSYVAYHRFVMPVPVELNGAAQLPAVVPQPVDGRGDPQPPTAMAERGADDEESPSSSGAQASPRVAAPVDEADETIGEAPPVEGTGLPAPRNEGGGSAETAWTREGETERGQEGASSDQGGKGRGDTADEAHATGAKAIPDDSGFATMMNTANTLFRRGRSKEALEAYNRALSYRPDAPQALSRVAYVHLNLGNNSRARKNAARAVEIDPTNSEGWIVLGAALTALGDRPGALAAYRKCATLGTGQHVVECRRLAR